jgi:ketosteroid isomerase-like protein
MSDMSHAGTEGFTAERLACINLVHAYNNDIDTGHAERVADLFVDDAVLDLGRALTGIDAIRAAMQARAANTERRTTHVTSNIQFTEIGAGMAATTSILLLWVLDADAPGAPNAIVRCNDEFIRLDNREWRFQRRSLSIVAGKI